MPVLIYQMYSRYQCVSVPITETKQETKIIEYNMSSKWSRKTEGIKKICYSHLTTQALNHFHFQINSHFL